MVRASAALRSAPTREHAGGGVRARAEHSEGPLALGRYRLGARLGAGGFGVVFAAVDERLGREVAVKRVPLPSGSAAGAADRARREALAAARLSHPGIVALYEAVAHDDHFYLVSELVHGQTLAALMAADDLDDEQALRIGVALCDALEHAHERGVVHRDVKPSNVIVPDRPGRAVNGAAKLADFGVARLLEDENFTVSGDVVGTFAYMAPEQAVGGSVTGGADLYSLGVVLYEALAGVNPVRGASPAATARRVGRRLPALARRRRDLPPELCAAIDQAVDPDPGRRGGLDELRAALIDALRGEGWAAAAARGGLRLPPPASVPGRLLGGIAAGTLATALLLALHPSPTPPALSVWLVVATAAAALPRLGWAAGAAALATWMAASGQSGTALLLVAGALPVVLLLGRRAGAVWSLPGLAPLLGLAGLAGAYPALAGAPRGLLRRAAAGALGWWWLGLAEARAGRRLWTGPAAALRPPSSWEHSAAAAAAHALAPLLSLGMLLGVLLWAGGAALLPLLVRGRNLRADIVLAAAWSAALAAAAARITALGGSGLPHRAPRELVLGAALAAALAVLGRAVKGPDSRSMADTNPDG